LDKWHGSLLFYRQFLKGWNRQRTGDQRKLNDDNITERLNNFGKELESRNMSNTEWERRFEVEKRLEDIYRMKEIYWKQSMVANGSYKVIPTPNFFCQYAKSRRRKSYILSQVADEEQEIKRKKKEIMDLIVSFYMELFGLSLQCTMKLAGSFGRLS
jgi:hypothetical protein